MTTDITNPFAGLEVRPVAPAPPVNPASDKQLAFIRSLAAGRQLAEGTTAEFLERLPLLNLTKQTASVMIDALLALPKAKTHGWNPNLVQPLAVPSGHYALEQDGVMKFYKVGAPTEGRWAGYVFLDAQASDEYFPIKNRATKDVILAQIAKNPQEAMTRYGKELGKCGHCHRILTSEWRLRGIGPVCVNKMGWS